MVGAPDAAFLVADPVQRGEDLGRELAGAFQDLLQGAVAQLGKARQVGVAVDLEDFAQQEGLVSDRRRIGHAGSGGPQLAPDPDRR
jgi:hypothetical protein